MPDLARLRAKRLFLLDLDGTLYLDERLFDGAADFLRAIRSRGGTYRFLTNNSSRGAESYVEKLRRLGVEAETSDFLTSVDALIAHLRAQSLASRARQLISIAHPDFRDELLFEAKKRGIMV